MKKILKQNIVKELGLDLLSAEDQEKALLSIGKIIFQAVLIRIMEVMSVKDKDELDKLLSKKIGEEELLTFLQSKEPNLDKIVEAEVIKFKEESLKVMQVA